MEIIPAIDLIDGKCVRLAKGDFSQQKVYNQNPLEVAKEFEAAGIKRLHLVDLDGAKAGKIKHINVLETIARNTSLQIDFGGGVKQIEDVNSVLNAGACFVTIGSLAVKNPSLLQVWLNAFGATKFLIGADTLNYTIKTNAWINNSGINIFNFISSLQAMGLTTIFCTDIEKDGMQNGPSLQLYKEILQTNKGINLIASGGVTTVNDIEALAQIGCTGAIIGKAFYEGSILLTDLKKYS
jgi:phosphoribosylformimino-5-aminoimidazole carboxamide ribotide isomerase